MTRGIAIISEVRGAEMSNLLLLLFIYFVLLFLFFISYPTFNWLRNQIHCIVHCICNIFLYFPNGSFMVCLYTTMFCLF